MSRRPRSDSATLSALFNRASLWSRIRQTNTDIGSKQPDTTPGEIRRNASTIKHKRSPGSYEREDGQKQAKKHGEKASDLFLLFFLSAAQDLIDEKSPEFSPKGFAAVLQDWAKPAPGSSVARMGGVATHRGTKTLLPVEAPSQPVGRVRPSESRVDHSNVA